MKTLDQNQHSLEIVTLSERQDLLNDCVQLLNNEWPRSNTARLRSLEQSFNVNDQPFPVSLLLIGKEGDKEILIGHSKILSVPYDIAKCFVESVVIGKSYRGKGFGRVIMEKTEAFAKSKGVEVIHLTTHNQQGFYQKLGYEFCDPIVVFGQCPQHLQKAMENILKRGSENNNEASIVVPSNTCNPNGTNGTNGSINGKSSSKIQRGPPPPPPPPQMALIHGGNKNQIQVLPYSAGIEKKLHMRKVLSS